ncbi:MAG: hypothetical protein ABIR71_14595 [Chthoniobacterales bacterium]
MNHLQKLGLSSFLFLGLGLASGTLVRLFLGGNPETGFAIALACYAVGLVLALIAFMKSRRGQSLDGTTKFIARAPLGLVTLGVLYFFLRAMIGI